MTQAQIDELYTVFAYLWKILVYALVFDILFAGFLYDLVTKRTGR